MPDVDVRAKYGAINGATVGNAPPIIPFSMSVEGLEGTGKTQFGICTGPLPVVHVNFADREATRFLYEVSDTRRKAITLYSFVPTSTQGWTRSEASKSLVALSEIAQSEMKDGKLRGGTFILDSGSSWWDAIQEVYVAPKEEERDREGKKRAGGLIYSEGNLIVSGVVSWLRSQGAFFVMTHQKRQRWDKDGPVPGAYDARINSKVPFLVEVRLDLRKVCAVETCGGLDCRAQGHIGRKHIGRLIKFAANTAMEGIEYYNEQINFANIYTLYAGGPFPEPERLA